jgi:hypothetical protein
LYYPKSQLFRHYVNVTTEIVVIDPKMPLFGKEGLGGDFMNSLILKSPFIPLFQRGSRIF